MDKVTFGTHCQSLVILNNKCYCNNKHNDNIKCTPTNCPITFNTYANKSQLVITDVLNMLKENHVWGETLFKIINQHIWYVFNNYCKHYGIELYNVSSWEINEDQTMIRFHGKSYKCHDSRRINSNYSWFPSFIDIPIDNFTHSTGLED